MSTFTWISEFGAEKQKKPAATQIKFGDGYEARQTYGINTDLQTWNLTFANREVSEIDEIDDFLEARGGVESFEWTPPRAADSIKVVCRSWNRKTVNSNIDSITAVFEEVAEP